MIRIENDGPRVIATNYWASEHALRGLVYVSINAGAVRVLLPEVMASEVLAASFFHELESPGPASMAVLSRGPWAAQDGRDGLELLLDDGSDEPYALHMDARQADRLWTPEDDGRVAPLTMWRPGAAGQESALLCREMRCGLRRVEEIPCLRPWGE